ncbi:hypothetical protein EDC94DRAFT_683068 [Helicostylum pulchrum]|nr:hypothetical protein EDC94DRAFT_683068 [Helicostylum pulchrum]
MFTTSASSIAIVIEYIATERIRSIFFSAQLCFYIFVLIENDFISFVDEAIAMVLPKEVARFFVQNAQKRLRKKELEEKLSVRARQLRSYVNAYEKLKDAFVKAKEKEDALEEELGLAERRLEKSDDRVRFLLKAIEDLSVTKTSLSQKIADMNTSMSAIPAKHEKDLAKMHQEHFVTINNLKKENASLKAKLSDGFVFV